MMATRTTADAAPHSPTRQGGESDREHDRDACDAGCQDPVSVAGLRPARVHTTMATTATAAAARSHGPAGTPTATTAAAATSALGRHS